MRHPAGLVLFPDRGPWPEPPTQRPEPAVAGQAVQGGGGRARAPRYLVIHLPAFALERCGYDSQDLAACVDEVKSATRLVALTPAARAEGLRVGMTASEARAQVPTIALEPLDAAAQAQDHQALLEAFAGFSDRLAPWQDQDLVLDVRGTAHLFGGEQGLLEQVRARAQALGHVCQLAIADDPLAAWALASHGSDDVAVPRGGGAAALARLPVTALRPSDSLASSLQVLGIRRIGTWAELDPASVAGRFGPEGIRLHRVARGQVASRLPWQHADGSTVVEGVVLGGPTIRLEPILFVLPGLLVRLCESLAQRDAMAVRLAVRLLLERGPPHVVRVRVGRPTRDPERLQRLVAARLERVRLDAPAVELLLEVEEHTAEQAWQPGLLDRAQAAEPLLDLLARMSDALGEATLVGPVPVDTWLPEEAWTGRPYQPGAPLPGPPVHRKGDRDPVAEQRHLEVQGERPRPACLLPRPERGELPARGGRPRRVRLEGAWQSVSSAEGPERLEGGWWRQDGGWTRDYWVVQVQGRTGWCFQDEQGRWWWHGWF